MGFENLSKLNKKQEKSLMSLLSRYPEVIELAAKKRAPHLLAHYLKNLANEFHSYYNAHTFIVTDNKLRNARWWMFFTSLKSIKHLGNSFFKF